MPENTLRCPACDETIDRMSLDTKYVGLSSRYILVGGIADDHITSDEPLEDLESYLYCSVCGSVFPENTYDLPIEPDVIPIYIEDGYTGNQLTFLHKPNSRAHRIRSHVTAVKGSECNGKA